MKIITSKSAYLQKYYFGILIKSTLVTGIGVPISMFEPVEKRSFDRRGSKDFIKFTKKEEIDFLQNATWIPDFKDYADKSSDEINEEIESIDDEGNELNKWFKSLSAEERSTKSEIGSTKAKMLMYRKESLKDILALKEKNKTPMPEHDLIKKLINPLIINQIKNNN